MGLKALIEYWETNYQLNYIHRTPQTNRRILETINYLKELLALKGLTL